KEALQSGAKAARQASKDKDEKVREIDVTTRVPDTEPAHAVAREARKGHDFMLIGVEKTLGEHGFDSEVDRIAQGFEGPFAIVVGNGAHLERPLRSPLSILVATSGTEASRRAAEVAIALARASRASITALYVTSGKPGRSKTRALRDMARTRQQEEAILKDVADTADRYDVSLRTVLRAGETPESVILREAQTRRHNLIVVGVSRGPGETLFFGNLAEAMLEQSDRSVLFVSSGGVSTGAQGKGQQKVQDDKAKEGEDGDESEAA